MLLHHKKHGKFEFCFFVQSDQQKVVTGVFFTLNSIGIDLLDILSSFNQREIGSGVQVKKADNTILT